MNDTEKQFILTCRRCRKYFPEAKLCQLFIGHGNEDYRNVRILTVKRYFLIYRSEN